MKKHIPLAIAALYAFSNAYAMEQSNNNNADKAEQSSSDSFGKDHFDAIQEHCLMAEEIDIASNNNRISERAIQRLLTIGMVTVSLNAKITIEDPVKAKKFCSEIRKKLVERVGNYEALSDLQKSLLIHDPEDYAYVGTASQLDKIIMLGMRTAIPKKRQSIAVIEFPGVIEPHIMHPEINGACGPCKGAYATEIDNKDLETACFNFYEHEDANKNLKYLRGYQIVKSNHSNISQPQSYFVSDFNHMVKYLLTLISMETKRQNKPFWKDDAIGFYVTAHGRKRGFETADISKASLICSNGLLQEVPLAVTPSEKGSKSTLHNVVLFFDKVSTNNKNNNDC